MAKLEQTVRELNKGLAEARVERVKTIEAHQSRISQLQEKYLHDLKHANSNQMEAMANEIRRDVCKQKEREIQALRKQLENVTLSNARIIWWKRKH
jgi:LytS/YehU family sensor histidine kinase